MRHALTLHPDSQCAAVTHIEVDVARPRPGELVLRYVLTGKVSDVRMPLSTGPGRTDELWLHTCFEAFVRAPPSGEYYEFNFAPSTQWAAYRFSGYRDGMGIAREMETPRMSARSEGARYEFQAALGLTGLPNLPSDGAWRLGLSVVIEESSGRKSYWALAHPPGKADFHHSDCFACELPAA